MTFGGNIASFKLNQLCIYVLHFELNCCETILLFCREASPEGNYTVVRQLNYTVVRQLNYTVVRQLNYTVVRQLNYTVVRQFYYSVVRQALRGTFGTNPS
jgi:hypothetical protein